MAARRLALHAVPPGAGPSESVRADVRVTIDGEPIDLEIVVPAARTRLHALMPVLRGLANLMAELGAERAERDGRSISCRKGCGACCRQPVPITASEAVAIAELVATLPEPKQSEVRARFQQALERLDAADLLDELRQPATLADADLAPLSRAYFELGIACPFLEDESCSIHSERPIACREYLVTSPAGHCARPSDENVERVRLPAESFRAVRAIDASASETAGWTTLVLALESAAQRSARPEQQSLAWLQQIFSKLSTR